MTSLGSLRSCPPSLYLDAGEKMPDRRLELGQRTVARLIIRLCINTGEQTDHPSGQAITRVVATGDRKQFQYLQ